MRDLCKDIKDNKMSVGLAIKPKTELTEDLFKLIDDKLVDMVLIMTVEPG